MGALNIVLLEGVLLALLLNSSKNIHRLNTDSGWRMALSSADQKHGKCTKWKLKLKNVKQGRKLKYQVLAGRDDCLPEEGVYYVWFFTVGVIM